MTRLIKFRAIHAECDPAFFTLTDIDGFGFIRMDTGFQEISKCHISQFTGLTDKNGVEIYEGDIVRFWTHRSRNKKGGIISAVEWSDEGVWLPFNDQEYIQDEQGDPIDHNRGFEVIGNIYENPELLQA